MASNLLPTVGDDAFVADVEDVVRDGGALALAITDLDDFATINTEHGRAAGDALLRSWERTLRGSLPKDAVVRRLGGDEYAVALPDTSAESALIVLEEIRSHYAANAPVETTVDASVGIAARPPHAATTGDLVVAARAALARAKREGRGRVAIFVEEKMVLKSNYYSRAHLDRLAKLSRRTGRTEASLLREALDDVLDKYRDMS